MILEVQAVPRWPETARGESGTSRSRLPPMSMRQVQPLQDGHGRVIEDLRVSVTDRCNFRCQYCMPAEGLPWLDRDADPALRGDRAPGQAVRLDGRRGRAPDRRRAARAARLPCTGRACWPPIDGAAGPLPDDQRLPARGHGGRPRRGRPAAHQRVARLALARPLLPDHAARRASAGDPRARGARAPSRDRARSRSTAWRCAASPRRRCSRSPSWRAASPTTCGSSSSCRSTPTTPGRRTAS